MNDLTLNMAKASEMIIEDGRLPGHVTLTRLGDACR